MSVCITLNVMVTNRLLVRSGQVVVDTFAKVLETGGIRGGTGLWTGRRCEQETAGAGGVLTGALAWSLLQSRKPRRADVGWVFPTELLCALRVTVLRFQGLYNCFTDTGRLRLLLSGLFMDAHEPLVTFAQVVPCPAAALAFCPGTDGTAAADPCGHPAFTAQPERLPGRAMDALTGRTVQGLKELLVRHILWLRVLCVQ